MATQHWRAADACYLKRAIGDVIIAYLSPVGVLEMPSVAADEEDPLVFDAVLEVVYDLAISLSIVSLSRQEPLLEKLPRNC